MRRIAVAFSTLIVVASQAGCSSTPSYPSVPDIPAGTTVQLSVVIPEWQTPNALTDTEGVVLLGAGGAAGGAVTGAAIGVGASMACGPAALFCAALTVPAGLLTGGIVGLSVGASEGASRGISADDAKKLESLLETAQLEHTHPESLAATFKEHASDFWTTTAEDSAVKITLGVAPLRIRQEKRSLIRFQTSISVLVDYGDGSKPRTFTFQRVTPLKSADTLLTDDGALTERVIGDLYKHGIRHVVFALSDSITAYAPRSPSTDESP